MPPRTAALRRFTAWGTRTLDPGSSRAVSWAWPELPDLPGAAGVHYLLLRRSEVSLCVTNPGFPEELCLRADRRTLIRWWRGDLTFRQALGGGLTLEGRREWVRAFPGWFERYLFAEVTPASRVPPARRVRQGEAVSVRG